MTERQSLDLARGVALFVAVLWIVFLVDRLLPLERLGLVPRTLAGLPGIVAMPFLHKSLAHLAANTVPLIVLLAMLSVSSGLAISADSPSTRYWRTSPTSVQTTHVPLARYSASLVGKPRCA